MGQTLSLAFSILPSQNSSITLSAQLHYLSDEVSSNNSDTSTVGIILGIPNLVIKSPAHEEYIAQSSTGIIMQIDLPGTPPGEQLRYYLDGDTKGVVVSPASQNAINLGPLSDGWHRVTLEIVDINGDVVREHLARTIRFEVGTPRVRMIAPEENVTLMAVDGADLRLAFAVDAWPLSSDRYFSWDIDGEVQAERLTRLNALNLSAALKDKPLKGKHKVTIKLYRNGVAEPIASTWRDITIQ